MKKLFASLSFLPCLLFAQTVEAQHSVGQSIQSSQIKSANPRALTPIRRVAELLPEIKMAKSGSEQADLLFEIATIYLYNLKVDSGLFYVQQLKRVADSVRYEDGLGKYHYGTAYAAFLRSNDERFLLHLNKATEIFSSQKNKFFLGLCYRLKARQLEPDDVQLAQDYYRKALPLIESGNDLRILHGALHDFGNSFYYSFELDSAIIYLSRASEIAELLNNPIKIVNTASALGSIQLLAGNFKEAESVLHHALQIRPANSDRMQGRILLVNYAESLIWQDKWTKAAEAIKEIEKLNSTMPDVPGKLEERRLKGILYYRQDRNVDALQFLKEAYEMRDKVAAFGYNMSSVAQLLGMAELKAGQPDSAIIHFYITKKKAEHDKFIPALLEVNMLLAQAFQQKGALDSALHYFKKYSDLKDQFLTVQKEKTVMELTARYGAEKKETQIKGLQKEQQLFAYQLQLKNTTIEQQLLLDKGKSQQLALLSQQSQISQLEAAQKNLELQNREKEFLKNQSLLLAANKENSLQVALAQKEAQRQRLLYIVIAGILVFVVYGLYRYRQAVALRKKLTASLADLKNTQEKLIKAEAEKETENLRQRISRDIHDEVGATLSGVALFSEIARQKMKDHQEADAGDYLEHISANSKEMVEKMSDIIWAINPKNDSFERILFKLQSYAMNLCTGKGIQLHFEIEESLRSISPTMQDRKNIYLLMKEAINNAVKYSGAGRIGFFMRKKDALIIMEVNDNGKGFHPLQHAAGNGLANMEARAKELNASFQIISEPGQGTIVRLQFKIHLLEVQQA